MAKLSGQKAHYQPAELALIRRCWATYTAYYLGRVNISPAFPLLAAALGLSLGEVGWLGTVFFWAYGVGQLVHGQLGNVIRPRWMVLFGLVVIAVTNLLFAAQDAFAPMLALWAMNGFAQAAGWGPMLRILNARFDERQRRHLATPFAMSFQVGTAASWGISVLLLALGAEWRALFWLPGIMLALAAFAWWRSGLDAPPNHSANPNANLQWSEITRELRTWWPYLFIAACTGFVYLGLLLWLPTLVAANVPLPPNWQRAQTALLPLLGVPGMLLAGRLLASGKDALQTTRIFQLTLIASTLGGALLGGWMTLIATFVAVLAASGLASLTLSALPLLLAPAGRVSSAGGLLTAVWSVAGGASGTVIGSLAESGRWAQVFGIWAASICAALLFMEIARKQRRKLA